MKPERKARILAYNKAVAETVEKASDLDSVLDALMQLPPGQLKKILTDKVLSVLAKYGIKIEA